MTAAALAWNYAQPARAACGTGAGEGALSPAAQSMLADYFAEGRTAAALGVFSMGIYVGNGAALVLGGAVTAAGDLAWARFTRGLLGRRETLATGVLHRWPAGTVACARTARRS